MPTDPRRIPHPPGDPQQDRDESGWPTFPMVFVKGVLVGGASDLAKLIKSGELKAN